MISFVEHINGAIIPVTHSCASRLHNKLSIILPSLGSGFRFQIYWI